MPTSAELARALLAPDRPVPAGLAPAGRFAVYRNNVVVGLREALAAAYPAVRSIVGDDFFAAAAGVFVRQEPPRSPVLIHYGEGFPAFLQSFAPARRLPYLADVARLERAWLEAYHAADATPVAVDVLGALAGDRLAALRVALHPACRRVASPWPVVALWAANTGRGAHVAVDLDRAETALVLRPAEQVQVHVVDPGLAMLVRALAAGTRLGAAVEAAAAASAAFDPGPALGRLFALGAVSALDDSQPEDGKR